MKKKVFLSVLTVVMIICTFGLFACGHSHSYSANWSSDESQHWHVCTDSSCGEKSNVGAHTYGSPVVTVAATCNATGEQKITCTVCGYAKTEAIAKLAHNWATEWSSDSAKHYHVCKNEGCTETTADADHGTWRDGNVITPATCTDAGEKNVICNVCDYTTTAEIPATGHAPGEFTVTHEPTCTEAGVETATCAQCGETVTQSVAAKGHTPFNGEYTVTHEPTCTEEGSRYSSCEVCGEQFTEVMPVLPHDWSEWHIVGNNVLCTEVGEKERQCSMCNKKEKVEKPAEAHRFADWSVTTPATCNNDGLRVHECSVCGFSENQVIKATGHKYTDWQITYPTDEKAGVAIKYCEGDSAHNIEVTLPALSPSVPGYVYNSSNGTYECTVAHASGDIKFITYNIKSLDDAVRVAQKTQTQVIHSTANRHNVMVTENGAQTSNSQIVYELGANYAHIVDAAEKREYFYSLNNDGSLFPVMTSYIGDTSHSALLVSKDVDATLDSLNGYGYGFTFMTDGSLYNGLGTFINYLYTVGKMNVNKDFKSEIKTVSGKTVYSFSYGFKTEKYFDIVEVEFSFDANFIVGDATVSVKTYANKESAANPEIKLDDPLLTIDEDGHYCYDGKLLIAGETNDGYIYATLEGDHVVATGYIDSDGTPRMRVAITAAFAQRADGTYYVVTDELGAEADWANYERYTVSQTSQLAAGEKLPTNPYRYEDFVISSFDMEEILVDTDSEGKETITFIRSVEDGAEIEIDANQAVTFRLTNVLPSTYNPYFDGFVVYLIDEAGNRLDGTGITNITDGEIGYYFGGGNTGVQITKDYRITIKSLLAGEWDLFAVTENTEFRFHLVVNAIAADPFYVEVKEYNDLTGKESWNRTLTTVTVYQEQEVVIRGVVGHPSYENSNYTVSASKDNTSVTGTCIKLTPVDGLPLYTFSAKEVGTYTVTIYPALGIATSITVKVKEAPNVSQMLDGEFGNADKGYQVALNPTTGGALSGTATIVKGFGDDTETTIISYVYNDDTREFTCEYVSGAVGDMVQGVELPYNYGLKLSNSYKLYLTYESGFNGERVEVLIGGFENNLVCEDSIIIAKDRDSAKKLVANVSGIYRVTSNWGMTFASVNGGDPVLLTSLGDVTLYVGDYIKIWNGTATDIATYTIELIEALEMVYVENVEFESETAIMRVEGTLALVPVFTPENTTQRGLVYKTSDASVATVDENGIVTAIKTGTVTVTATTNNGKFTASVEITVLDKYALVEGENVIYSVGPFWNQTYVFNGDEDKSYTVEVVHGLAWGSGAVTYNGINYSYSDASVSFTVSGGVVTLSISQYSYGEASVIVTITEKISGGDEPETRFTPLNVTDTTITMTGNDYVNYTLVGAPNTTYTISSGSFAFYNLVNGSIDYESFENYSKSYTTDANGHVDICLYCYEDPTATYTITITTDGDDNGDNGDNGDDNEKIYIEPGVDVTLETLDETGITLYFADTLIANHVYRLSCDSNVTFMVGYLGFGNPVEFTYGVGVSYVTLSSDSGELSGVVITLEDMGEKTYEFDAEELPIGEEKSFTAGFDYVPFKIVVTEDGVYTVTIIGVGEYDADFIIGMGFEEYEGVIDPLDANVDGTYNLKAGTYCLGIASNKMDEYWSPVDISGTVKIERTGDIPEEGDNGGNESGSRTLTTNVSEESWKSVKVLIGDLNGGEEITIVLEGCAVGSTYTVYWYDNWSSSTQIDVIMDGYETTNRLVFTYDGTTNTVVIRSNSGDLTGVEITVYTNG